MSANPSQSASRLLRRACPRRSSTESAERLIDQAQARMEATLLDREVWLASEIKRLQRISNRILHGIVDGALVDDLFAFAHELRGSAEHLGVGELASICEMLCAFIDGFDEPECVPPHILRVFVDAALYSLQRAPALGSQEALRRACGALNRASDATRERARANASGKESKRQGS